MNAVLDNPVAIARFQLLALRSAIKLEALGLKKRGRSATMVVRQHFGLPVGVSRDVLIQKLDECIKEYEQ